MLQAPVLYFPKRYCLTELEIFAIRYFFQQGQGITQPPAPLWSALTQATPAATLWDSLFFSSFSLFNLARFLSGRSSLCVYFRGSAHVMRNIFATGPPCRTFIFKDWSEECVNGDRVNLYGYSASLQDSFLCTRDKPVIDLIFTLKTCM